MPQLNEFQRRLQAKMVILDELDRTLKNGGTPDMVPINADVAQLCKEMSASSPDILEAMLPRMQEMITYLKDLTTRLEEGRKTHEGLTPDTIN